VEGADQRARQAWGKILPSLDLNLTYGYSKSDANAPVVTEMPPGSFWSGAATLTLTIPLFDRLTNYSSYQAQIHTKALAEIDLDRTRRNAESEWRTARDTLLVALRTAKSRDETLAVSRRLYQDNLLRFRKGLVDANELSVDQERSYNAELFAIRGWSGLHTSFARLCHAMGLRVERCLDRT
jgi:outer membrane protein TolC